MTRPRAIAEIIRERRLAMGMSLGQLASRVGKTAASVRSWERGEEELDPELRSKLAEVLELDSDQFVPVPDTVDAGVGSEPASDVVSEPEAVVEPEQEVVSEPAPEVVVEPEAVVEPELEVVSEPAPEVVPEPEVVVEPEAVVEPELEVVPEPEVVVEPEAVVEPELEVVPEPEVVVEPEAVVEPELEVVPEPEVVVEPEAVVEPELEVVPEPEVVVEPEAVVEPEPEVVEPPVMPEPEVTTEPEVVVDDTGEDSTAAEGRPLPPMPRHPTYEAAAVVVSEPQPLTAGGDTLDAPTAAIPVEAMEREARRVRQSADVLPVGAVVVPYYMDDPREKRRYWVRTGLTVAVLFVLLLLVLWSGGHLSDAIGEVIDQFGSSVQ